VDLYGTTIVWSKAIGSGRVVLFEVEEPKKELTGVVMAETAKAR
jgi:hypothetical protein